MNSIPEGSARPQLSPLNTLSGASFGNRAIAQPARLPQPNYFVCAVIAATLAVAGCAPGVNNRSLGRESPPPERAATESAAPSTTVTRVEAAEPAPQVVVVEPEPEPAAQIRAQEREIAQLRDELDANRSRADAADLTAREAQQAVEAMRTELADIRASADAATAQSQKAFEIATEVLSNLIAAREAQRNIVERNLETFGAMDQRLAGIEGVVTESRRQRESDVAASLVLSAETEMKLQRADQELVQLREQLTELNQQNEQLRGAFDSAPMMSMLRELEEARRETSMLRGAMEQVQREQDAGRKRLQNYYIDLDARIQALQDESAAARAAATDDIGAADGVVPDSAAIGLEEADSSLLNVPGPAEAAIEGEALPPLEVEPYELMPQAEDGVGAAVVPPPQETPVQNDSLLEEQADLVGAAREDARSAATPSLEPVVAPDDTGGSDEFRQQPESEGTVQIIDLTEPSADLEGTAGDGGQVQVYERQPVTAHGVITTDWEVAGQPAVPAVPDEPLE